MEAESFVERELQNIDAEFASGQLNAFGRPEIEAALFADIRDFSQRQLELFLTVHEHAAAHQNDSVILKSQTSGNSGGADGPPSMDQVEASLDARRAAVDGVTDAVQALATAARLINGAVAESTLERFGTHLGSVEAASAGPNYGPL